MSHASTLPARTAPPPERSGDASHSPDRTTGWAEPRWLTEVRLRATRRVLWLRHRWAEHRYEDEQWLGISHSEIDRALGSPAEAARAERAYYSSDAHAVAISAEIDVLAARPEDVSFEHLSATLGLAPSDVALLKLALAAAVAPAIARVFGYLLDAGEPADPTWSLAAALFDLPGGPPPGPDSPLVRWLLAQPVAAGCEAFACSTGWRADALLLPALIDHPLPATADHTPPRAVADWSAGTMGRIVEPPPGPLLRPEALAQILDFVQRLGGQGEPNTPIEIELVGPPASGRTTLAAQAAARLGSPLVVVDAAAMPDGEALALAATREARRARLGGALLAWEHADAVPAGALAAVPLPAVTFTSVESPALGSPRCGSLRCSIRCEQIGRRERIALWSSLSNAPVPPEVADWALRPGEISLAACVAPAGEQAIRDSCRRLLTGSRPDLLTPLPLSFEWSDLVLAPTTVAHLRELEAQARDRGQVLDDWDFSRLTPLGRGTTALFAGPSGTGKTMAAQVLARSLGLELYRVDLAGVVNKYIGETEKHLRAVFDVCERAPVLLLFDEADALFGKRSQVSDAHDRYANIEIDYLLSRMEQFDGVAILTTNRKGDLDTAFVRRLRFIVDFAPPGRRERERLWRLALEGAGDAEGRPLVDDLDWERLARELDLTGAAIKSAALAAAFLARADSAMIAERHVLAAARRELEKQGVVVRHNHAEPL